ncbi:MAG: thiolase family protein, partial [Proteobacteria bacterium]|nr:thiolase family protein [Pseudomonadota bacterium]
HGNAKDNPCAQLPMDLTVEEVMNSRVLATPLKLLDCSPISDGAAAIILASEERAKGCRRKPVWARGVGHTSGLHYLGDRDLTDTAALQAAARRAYDMAGITRPSEEIDFFEVYDAFSYMEPLWLEGLGLCEPGQAGPLTRRGATARNGRLPVNVSGGVLSAHAVMVAGLARIIEVVLQIRGAAGARQLDKARVGLAQGINGPCGQSHCVWVFGEN